VDQIPKASKNNVPNLPVEKYDILLDVVQVELSIRAHVE